VSGADASVCWVPRLHRVRGMAAADLAGRDEVTAEGSRRGRGPTWRRAPGRHRDRAGRSAAPARTPGRGPLQRRWPPHARPRPAARAGRCRSHSAQPVHAVGPASSSPSPRAVGWTGVRPARPPVEHRAEARKPDGCVGHQRVQRSWAEPGSLQQVAHQGLRHQGAATDVRRARPGPVRGLLEAPGSAPRAAVCSSGSPLPRVRAVSIPQGGRGRACGRPGGVDLRWTHPDGGGDILTSRHSASRERSTGDGLEDHLHPHGRSPLLATYSFLPIIQAYAGAAGVSVETRDISLAGRIIAQFPDRSPSEQRSTTPSPSSASWPRRPRPTSSSCPTSAPRSRS
jgi:isocitrate dehydrogenase